MNPFAPMLRVLRRRLRTEERGFTLVEMMVAQGVILVSLLSLAYTTTIGFKDIALARERDSANGILNRVMEEVRALPLETVQKGLSTTDPTAAQSGTECNLATVAGAPCRDSRILRTGCPSDPTGRTYQWCYQLPGTTTQEGIPHGDTTTASVPLNPHFAPIDVGPTRFTRYIYVSYYLNRSNQYRVTGVVDWDNVARHTSGEVIAQTVISTSSECASSAAHPFAAPCQPFTFASGQVDSGQILLVPTPGENVNTGQSGTNFAGVRGIRLDRAAIRTLALYANSQSEQISLSQSRSVASSVDWKLIPDAAISTAGGAVLNTSADSDPAQPAGFHDPATGTAIVSATTGATTYSASGNSNTMTETYAAGDHLEGISTMTASSAAHPCGANAGLPCGRAQGAQPNTNLINLTLAAKADQGVARLVEFTGVGTGSEVVVQKRLTGADGSMKCDITRRIGTVRFGGIGAGVVTPPGWDSTKGLVYLSNYSATLKAAAGTGLSATDQDWGLSGTVQYYNPTRLVNGVLSPGYTTIDYSTLTGPTTFTVALDHDSRTVSGNKRVQIVFNGTFTVGAATKTTVPASGTTLTSARAAAAPALQGSMTYQVNQGPNIEADKLQAALTYDVNLGGSACTASYSSAPAVA
ncbi:MAG: hypothetical protein LC722_05695 [Actinobacteria bacterium]|nr:hypothetical protein [Actinomycetota bacterium]